MRMMEFSSSTCHILGDLAREEPGSIGEAAVSPPPTPYVASTPVVTSTAAPAAPIIMFRADSSSFIPLFIYFSFFTCNA